MGALDAAGAGGVRLDAQTPDEFLSAIAVGATVQDAAAEVGLSRRSAYALRRRADGRAFDLGWQAADILARDSLRETLWDRAQNGQSWTTVRDDDEKTINTTRHRFDNRPALSMLTRLEARVTDHPHADEVRVSGRFDALLTLIESGEAPAERAAIVAQLAPAPLRYGTCESCEPDADDEDDDDRIAADEPPVFKRSWSPDWLTRFPPPEDYMGEEDGYYGEPDYSRELTGDEDAAVVHFRQPGKVDPLATAADAAARDAWFAAAPNFTRAEDVVVAEESGPLPSGGDDSPGGERGEGFSAEN